MIDNYGFGLKYFMGFFHDHIQDESMSNLDPKRGDGSINKRGDGSITAGMVRYTYSPPGNGRVFPIDLSSVRKFDNFQSDDTCGHFFVFSRVFCALIVEHQASFLNIFFLCEVRVRGTASDKSKIQILSLLPGAGGGEGVGLFKVFCFLIGEQKVVLSQQFASKRCPRAGEIHY